MKIIAMAAIVSGALATGGCLRHTEFRCSTSADCGAGGTCQPVGYCSFPDSSCGERFGDSAGPYANQCVAGGGPGVDGAIVDSMVDAAPCSGFTTISGLTHTYKLITTMSMWQVQSDSCTAAGGYLAIPDDTNELQGIDNFVGAAGVYWVGVDDMANEGTFVTVKGQAAAFLPWATNQPDNAMNSDCVDADPATALYDDVKCNDSHVAVCECEP